MDDLMSIYIEDMKEYLVLLSDSIMALEKKPDNKAAIGEMFRAFHTMKSSTAVMEFKKTAAFIHRMEDLLHEVREGRIGVDQRIIKLLFRSNDLLESFLDNAVRGNEGDADYDGITDEVCEILNRYSGEGSRKEPAGSRGKKGAGFLPGHDDLEKLKLSVSAGRLACKLTAVISGGCIYKAVRAWMILEEVSKHSEIIRSWPEKPKAEDFRNGSFAFDDTVVCAVIATDEDPASLQRELGMSMSEIESIHIESMNVGSDAAEDMSALVDGIIGKDSGQTDQTPLSGAVRIGEILIHEGRIKEEDVGDIIKKQKESYPGLKFGQIAVKEGKADVDDIIHALNIQGTTRGEPKNQAYIRIPSVKVDNLIDLMGELLITQSLHKQEISDVSGRDTGRLVNNIMRMERIAKDIQNITMSLRMVSLRQTFQKIYRIGRDTASELGRNVDIITSGEDTEIDRNVVEKIHDPLMHLIRNAISHGIESEEERSEKGKPARGNISIQAYNRRGNVYIEISDDGRGLSPEKIYRKALEKGLADPSRKYGDDDILKLIYLPGFSTEDSVNSISGRGVGMNVVQTEISRLGGKIDIENRPSVGCTFILKIPVNLATINGTIVDIHGGKYVIPTLGIKQILKPQKEQWIPIKGKLTSILIRNDIIQIIPIGTILKESISEEETEAGLVMVVEHEKQLMALPVRAVLGKQEIVVKPMGSDFGDLKFVSGATILGDGRVSLILDVEALFRMAEDADE